MWVPWHGAQFGPHPYQWALCVSECACVLMCACDVCVVCVCVLTCVCVCVYIVLLSRGVILSCAISRRSRTRRAARCAHASLICTGSEGHVVGRGANQGSGSPRQWIQGRDQGFDPKSAGEGGRLPGKLFWCEKFGKV